MLFRSKTGERRSSAITKTEIYKEHIEGKYAVAFVLEDRTKNVEAWRKLGIRCFQVDEGDF